MVDSGQVTTCTNAEHVEGRGCPAWCTDCRHDHLPGGVFWHHGPAHEVTVYGQSCDLYWGTVRVAFYDKPPADLGTDPPDLERPAVRFEVPGDNVDLDLTPAQARHLAAALVRGAAAADDAGHTAAESAASKT